MKYSKLREYSVDGIANIIPLDEESCLEVFELAMRQSGDAGIRQYLGDLLGDSEEAVAFIEKFLKLKREAEAGEASRDCGEKDGRFAKQEGKKVTSSSGNGGAWELPERITTNSTNGTKKGRLEKSKGSTTTSQLLVMKPSNQLGVKQEKRSKKKNLDNLKDIEAAINDLEIESQGEKSRDGGGKTRRKCNCMGTRHALFEIAPNCLNCGKIICVKEGLQPCSFCGRDILSVKDRLEILAVLKQEKELGETKKENPRDKSLQDKQPTAKNKKKIVVKMNAGENLWKAQEQAFKEVQAEKSQKEVEEKQNKELLELDEENKKLKLEQAMKFVNPDLFDAQERLETLLKYQETGAERTRIIDNASDYEILNLNSSGSMWLSPVERALQLKQQQRKLRKQQAQENERTGRGNKTLEMVIRDGKVSMVEKTVVNSKSTDNDDDYDDDDELSDIERLKSHVKEEKSTNENKHLSYWDYKKDRTKWEKPMYIPTASEPKVGDVTSRTKSRVQIFSNDDEDELLVKL